MTSEHGAIVVVGSGPGIGVSVAALFASKKFSPVFLLARNADRLKQEAEAVRSQAGSEVDVHTVPVDLAYSAALEKGLKRIDEILQKADRKLECVHFNAARVAPSDFFDTKPEEVEVDFKTTVLGCYSVAAWAMPQLAAVAKSSASAYKPSFLVTSGLLYKDPFPHLFSLSLCKSAQYNLIQSLAKKYGEQGVHCGLVVVAAMVDPKSSEASPQKVAEMFWELYSQGRDDWTLDLVLREKDYDAKVQAMAEQIEASKK